MNHMTDPKERQDFLKAEARAMRNPFVDACDCIVNEPWAHAADGSPTSCGHECHLTKEESRAIAAELREDD